MKRRGGLRWFVSMAVLWMGCCVHAGVLYSNNFNGAEFAAAGVSTLYQNAAETGGQLVSTSGGNAGLLIDLSALDLMNDTSVDVVKVTAVSYRSQNWQTVGFATQTNWWHPDAAAGNGHSPYYWAPQGQLRSGTGHFSGGTEWDGPDVPANKDVTVEMTFYKNTSSTNDDTATVVVDGVTMFNQQVLEYGTNGVANLAGVQLVLGNDTDQYFDSVVVETDPLPPAPGPKPEFAYEFNTIGDTEGWISNGVDGLDVSNAVSGAEIVIASGSILNGDPQIVLNSADLSPGAYTWDKCTVRKRLLDAADNPVAFSSGGTLLRLQTNGVNVLYLSPANTVESDGWGISTYDISGLEDETIASLRYDAVAGLDATNQNFEIDYIRLSTLGPTLPPEKTLVKGWEFNASGNTEGFVGANHIDGLTVAGAVSGSESVLTCADVTGGDAIIRLPYNAAVSPGGTWDTLEIRIRQLNGNPPGGTFKTWAIGGTLVVMNEGQADASNLGGIVATTTESDGWITSVVDISYLEGSPITQLRVDPIGGDGSGNFEIDYIRAYAQVSSPVVGYDLWTFEYGLTDDLGLVDADPDKDLYDNAYEYAFGGNPREAADTGLMPVASVVNVGSNVLEVVCYERSDVDSGVEYSFEGREDLVIGSWMGLVESVDYTVVGTGSYNAEMDAVTNHIPVDADIKFIQTKATVE